MRGVFYAVMLTISLPAAAQADSTDTPTDNLVVTADRTPARPDAVPASVTVIDRATIETRGYQNLVDALSDVPGMRVVQSGGPGSVASVFMRGTNSNQVLVLRDGVPLNDPSDPGGAFNFGVTTLGDIERIEIVRGPMSSVYGSGAIGGVINLISRKTAKTLSGDLSLAGGYPRAFQAIGDLSGHEGIWDFAANAENNSSQGSDQTPPRETAIYTGEPDGFRNDAGRLEIGVTPFTDTRFSLLLRGETATYGYDIPMLDASNATGTDNSALARLGATTKLLDGQWDSSLFLGDLQTDRHYVVTLDSADPNQNTENDHYQGGREDLSWTNIYHIDDWGWLSTSHLTLGAEQSEDNSKTSIASNSLDYGPYASGVDASSHEESADLGLGTTLWRQLTLNAQLRQDWTSLGGDATTWRTGLLWALPTLDTDLHASYGTSFRAPALFDRYGIDSYGYMGNPDLKPEYGVGFDAGVRYHTDLGNPDQTLRVDMTYFNTDVHDLITLAYAPVYTSVNVGRARMRGVETEFDLTLARFLSLMVTYTYTDAQDLDTDSELLRRPKQQGSIAAVLRPVPPLSIAPVLRYTGDFTDYIVSDTGAQSLNPGYAPGGWVADLDINWRQTAHTAFFVAIKNLTDSHFEPVSGYQIPGISFLAGVRTGF